MYKHLKKRVLDNFEKQQWKYNTETEQYEKFVLHNHNGCAQYYPCAKRLMNDLCSGTRYS